jgi:glyoxylase-like metal-dependent hydrolase (beta-lactamase superfamily II)
MEKIADGVHLVRGGLPRVMNVYLIEDAGGMTMFDAGVKGMDKALRKAAAPYGGIARIVLGHSHADHRGAAPALASGGVPVFCHEAELTDAETDGGLHYFKLEELNVFSRAQMRFSLTHVWDGGPVPIEGTLGEGDEVAGFQVIHLPGHAPGLIGLYRERDGLVLGSDAVYTLNPLTGLKGAPRIPLGAFNLDTEQAKRSALKLAALEPGRVWAGHANGIEHDAPAVLDELGRKGGVLGKT